MKLIERSRLQTGKFGLGFNAVYHFTDLPSFVSGEYLVCFDPHAKFLPGATIQVCHKCPAKEIETFRTQKRPVADSRTHTTREICERDRNETCTRDKRDLHKG